MNLNSNKRARQKTDFVSKLKEIQLYHKKLNGNLVLNYKLDVLKEIPTQQHLMTEDEYCLGQYYDTPKGNHNIDGVHPCPNYRGLQ